MYDAEPDEGPQPCGHPGPGDTFCGEYAGTEHEHGNWVAATHRFEQVPDVYVRVCHCGKWPDHHVHTGDPDSCSCDWCQVMRSARKMIGVPYRPG